MEETDKNRRLSEATGEHLTKSPTLDWGL